MHKTRAAVLRAFALFLTAASPPELARWRDEAARVTITRDDWGIAHVHGKTDADAVFGMIYAQAEDDFPRIEANYLTALGRTAEAEGEKAIWQDLRARLYVSDRELKADYARSPPSMRKLMDAWADGLNYFLATHPDVQPRVLTRFEPWMALSFTEGSIGGDIERIDLDQLEAFLREARRSRPHRREPGTEPQGSNGIAIAPKLTERRQRAAADQSAHQLLLPLRAADDRATRGSTSMAPRPGASSSSTRASTRTPAGCTRRAASIVSTSSPRSERRGNGSAIATARCRPLGCGP